MRRDPRIPQNFHFHVRISKLVISVKSQPMSCWWTVSQVHHTISPPLVLNGRIFSSQVTHSLFLFLSLNAQSSCRKFCSFQMTVIQTSEDSNSQCAFTCSQLSINASCYLSQNEPSSLWLLSWVGHNLVSNVLQNYSNT